jgi:predicted small lipoprotein YifL
MCVPRPGNGLESWIAKGNNAPGARLSVHFGVKVNFAGVLLWCPAFGCPDLEFCVNRSVCLRLAMIGALALTLSACGRKGPLDPPPGGQALEHNTLSRTPVSNLGTHPVEEQAKPQVEYDEDGRPIAPPGPKKRSPADWLLN